MLIKLSFLTDADPLTVLALRMAFAFPVFFLSALYLNGKSERRISLREWRTVLLFGFIGYYFSPLVNFAGLQYVSVGMERMLLYTYPTFVVIGGLVLFGQSVSRLTWVAVVLTYVGIVIAYSGELTLVGDRRSMASGAGLILLSALTYSAFVLYSRAMIVELGALRFTSTVLSVSCVFTFIHYAFFGEWDRLTTLPTQTYRYAILLAVFGTILPSFLMGVGLRRAGSQRFAVITTIGPPATVVLAWIFLGEVPNRLQVLGLVVTLSGGLLIGLSKGSGATSRREASSPGRVADGRPTVSARPA